MPPTRMTHENVLAMGTTVYGQIVRVTESHYDPPLPGVGDTAISVSVTGTRERAPLVAGFRNIEDAKRFIHSTNVEKFTAYTADGDEYEESRQGLGVPKGMIGEFGDTPEIAVGQSATVNRFLANPEVGTAQTTATEPQTQDGGSEANVPSMTETTPTGSGDTNNTTNTGSNAGTTATEGPTGTREAKTTKSSKK